MKNKVPTATLIDNKDSVYHIPTINRLVAEGNEFAWSSGVERLQVSRAGVPYAAFEVMSQRLDVPVKSFLDIFGLPQTTYNKKRREHARMNHRDSEMILFLTELLDFGIQVFNGEELKFQRWMKKPNLALDQQTPESLLDSLTGIQEVKRCLQRIEFGTLA